jgi:uncharacterized protein YpmB
MKKLSKKQKWVIAFIAVILVVLGGAVWRQYQNSQATGPHDLGANIKYISKEDSGCFPFPFSFVCVERPSSDYFFITTMTPDDIKVYFKGANYVDYPNDAGGVSADYTFKNLHFARKADQKEFEVTYYDNTQAVAKSKNLKVSGDELVLVLSDVDYTTASASLGN